MNRARVVVPIRPAARTAELHRATEQFLQELEEPEAMAAESSWVVSYLDVLLLLITLFAVLLGLSYLHRGGDGPQAQTPPILDVDIRVPAAPAPVDPKLLADALRTLVRPPAPAATPKPVPASDPAPVPVQRLATALPAGVLDGLTRKPARAPAPTDLDRVLQRIAAHERNRLDLFSNRHEIRLEVRDDILFPLGSAELGPDGRALLARLAAKLAGQHLRISVEGHTDDLAIATARFPSNWELSSYRATTVARQLIADGIPRERIEVIGYADTRPRFPNDTPEHRARNRRVAIVVHRPEPAATAAAALPGQDLARLLM